MNRGLSHKERLDIDKHIEMLIDEEQILGEAEIKALCDKV